MGACSSRHSQSIASPRSHRPDEGMSASERGDIKHGSIDIEAHRALVHLSDHIDISTSVGGVRVMDCNNDSLCQPTSNPSISALSKLKEESTETFVDGFAGYEVRPTMNRSYSNHETTTNARYTSHALPTQKNLNDNNISTFITPDVDSMFCSTDMRCLALVAHNHMKPAMVSFVIKYKHILKMFRLSGTNSTMTVLQKLFKDEKNIVYGPVFKSGPLGGDAEIVSLMCQEDLGGLIFFQDPMDQHPHQSDIDCLNRQTLVHNIAFASNPTTAEMLMVVLRHGLETGNKSSMPSFFKTVESPSVKEYKREQRLITEMAEEPVERNELQHTMRPAFYRRDSNRLVLLDNHSIHNSSRSLSSHGNRGRREEFRDIMLNNRSIRSARALQTVLQEL